MRLLSHWPSENRLKQESKIIIKAQDFSDAWNIVNKSWSCSNLSRILYIKRISFNLKVKGCENNHS